ncbi:FAD-binding oxidoreductase, partial [Rathayibacter tritici]
MHDHEILRLLRDTLGDAVLTEGPEFEGVHTDKSGYAAQGRALALVTARCIADVQAALRIATQYRIPVVPRGAGPPDPSTGARCALSRRSRTRAGRA